MKADNDNRPYPPELCSAETMAYLLDIGTSTFRSYVARGLLPTGISRGGSVRWPRQVVIDAWTGSCTPAASARVKHDNDNDVDAAIMASIRKHGQKSKTRH